MCKRLLVLALVAMLSPVVLGDVIVDDHFDDDDIETNTMGIGTGFNMVEITNGFVEESDSFVNLINTVHGAARAGIASKEGAVLGTDIVRFEFRGVSFAQNPDSTGSGTTGRTAVGVRGDGTAEDTDGGVATGFWIQFESGDIGENNQSWSGTSTLFYESSADVKTVLATWEFDTLDWDAGTMDFTPVLDITLDLSPTGYSLVIEGDTISNVTGSLSGSYASAGITNELTTGHAFAFNQGEAPGLDMSIDQIVVTEGASGPELASLPSPANEATDVGPRPVLSWTPGVYANTHDVYFGTSFDDVNTAGPSDAEGVQVSLGQGADTYDPGLLDFGTTYYWRVDEVNAAPDNTVFKGSVWSFTTEPRYYLVADVNATISLATGAGAGDIGVTVDGSGLTDGQHGIGDLTMWLGTGTAGQPAQVQYDFDRVYKLYGIHIWNYNGLYEGFLGFGVKDITVEYATEPNEWVTLGDFEIDRATSVATYAGQLIDLEGIAAQSIRITMHSNRSPLQPLNFGLSEIQFLHKPVFAREPQPSDGATEVGVNTTLSWRAGREAAAHQVLFGTDSNAVSDGTAQSDTVAANAYDLPTLDLSMIYYWKIVEVNEAETPTSWASDVWSFSTPESLVVDDFESYTDDEGQEVFTTWVDGYGVPGNGSQVGHDDLPYAEETIVHGGGQAMPLRYGQGGATTSEATITLGSAQDWTEAGAQTLVLYFRGELGNAAGQLYVLINDRRVEFEASTAALAAPLWKQWNIDLATLGTTARSVRTMTIGVSGSGTGLLYIDDIRLYREASPMAGPAVDPGPTNLKALYAMEDNLTDGSGNGYDGTAEVGSSFGPGLPGYGRALVLDGVSGYATVPIGSLIASLDSITAATWVNWSGTGTWQRIFDFGNDTDVYMFMTPQSGAGLRFAITTSSSGGESQVTAGSALPSGWHHVAATIDGGTGEMILYLDGRMADSGTAETLPSDLGNTTQNWIGRSPWDDPYFNGSIDDFRIYDRALSDGEVRYLVGDR